MSATASVVIVSYNVSALLRECLKSVYAQGESCEVIVIDNASTDDSVKMVETQFPDAKMLANEKNVGFSAANNQGMQVSSGKYIFLLNPDTELKPGSVRTLIAYCESVNDDVLVGPQLVNSDGSLQVSAWKLPRPFDMISESLFLHSVFKVSQYPASRFSATFEPGMLSGAALFFPRTLYVKIGGLDPNLFWMEDADFAKRAHNKKMKVVYLPAAVVVHHSGQSSKKNLKRVIANQLLSKLKYYNKHSGTLTMMFTSLFCLLHIVSRLILFSLLAPFSQASAEKAGAYLFSAGRFFRYLFTGDQRVT